MSKYDEMYQQDNYLNVYDSFLTKIEIAFQEDTSKTGTNFDIENYNTEKIYPVIKFDSIDVSEGDNIAFINEPVSAREDLDVSNVVLDFCNQKYTADGEDILDKIKFNGDDRPYLAENDESSVSLVTEGTVEYYEYKEQDRERFVERFTINTSFIYNEPTTKLIEKEFDFDINQFKTSDFRVRDKIQEGETFRIKFRDVELEDYSEDFQYLLECHVTDFDYSFNNIGDLILHSLSGNGKILIN